MHNRINGAAPLKERSARERIVEGRIEGSCGQAAHLRDINTQMRDFTEAPAFVYYPLQFIVEMELRFAKTQMASRVKLMVGNPATSLVGRVILSEFNSPVQKKLVDGLKVVGLRTRSQVCGKTKRILKTRRELPYDMTDAGAMVPRAEVGAKMPDEVIQGSLATVEAMRNGTVEEVIATVTRGRGSAGEKCVVRVGCEGP